MGCQREELLQQNFYDVLYSDEQDASRLPALAALARGDLNSHSLQLRCRRTDGTQVWVQLTLSVEQSESGTPQYCIAIVQDISQPKQFEAELHEAVRQRDMFLAMLSHELRNPLAAVRHALSVLEHDRASEQTRERAWHTVRRQVRHISRLLDDLLDVARITQNKIEYRPEQVDFGNVVTEACAALAPMFDQRGVQLESKLPDEPIAVEGDPARLMQIIENLLNNACKYTPAGGRVEVVLERCDQRDQCTLAVRDTGRGIEPELLTTIFDMFVQSNDPQEEAGGGMGVGLALVKSLAEMHGGQVQAHSDGAGCGSQFELRLPCSAEPFQEQAADPTDTAARSDSTRILLVEDNADARQMLQTLLELEGFQVRAVGDGQSGLDAIVAEPPDVAVVDIGLPGMNGCELARKVRSDDRLKSVYLVALTGYGQLEDRQAAIEAGFDEHLVKPVVPELLQGAITRSQSR